MATVASGFAVRARSRTVAGGFAERSNTPWTSTLSNAASGSSASGVSGPTSSTAPRAFAASHASTSRTLSDRAISPTVARMGMLGRRNRVRVLSLGYLPPEMGGSQRGGVATFHGTLLEEFARDPAYGVDVTGVFVAPPDDIDAERADRCPAPVL